MADLTGADGGLRELALFAGAGGGILGGNLLGWRTVCAVERDAYAAQILAQRQNDRCLEPFPIWSDVCSFDGKPWRGIVDVVSGGFPCQDISAAGKGAGIDGARSGMWRHMARIIGDVLPRYVFVENSPLLVGRGAAMVIGDLASLGYDAQWACISASDCGAPHKRDRFWLVGNSISDRREARRSDNGEHVRHKPGADGENPSTLADANGGDSYRRGSSLQVGRQRSESAAAKDGYAAGVEWCPEPDVGRVANGVAARVDRLKAIGNGQVPRVAATAFTLLSGQ